VLGEGARIESLCATTGEPVRAGIGPDAIQEISPPGAVISFRRPDGPFGPDVILSFCHHVLFFASARSLRSEPQRERCAAMSLARLTVEEAGMRTRTTGR
jgi:hypothetical protein